MGLECWSSNVKCVEFEGAQEQISYQWSTCHSGGASRTFLKYSTGWIPERPPMEGEACPQSCHSVPRPWELLPLAMWG